MALPKIKLVNKDPTKPLHGRNCLVYLNDVLMPGVTAMSVDIHADSLAVFKFEMVGSIEVETVVSKPIVKRKKNVSRK